MDRKVLVVEDSVTVRDQLRRALTPCGFRVVYAVDGLEGLEKVAAHDDIDLMICDVNMPRMDGITMIETLKEQGSSIPVLMLTTEGQPELILRAKAAGAKGWVIKPFDEDLLVKAAKSLLARMAKA